MDIQFDFKVSVKYLCFMIVLPTIIPPILAFFNFFEELEITLPLLLWLKNTNLKNISSLKVYGKP